jgi:hypothetical protein
MDNDVCSASAFRAGVEGGRRRSGQNASRLRRVGCGKHGHGAGWLAVTYPRMLARRRRQAQIRWPEATALRALRVDCCVNLAQQSDLLDLIDDFVPLPLAVPETRPSTVLGIS